MLGRKVKQTIKEVTGKSGMIKKKSRQDQTKHIKQDIAKQRKKILLACRRMEEDTHNRMTRKQYNLGAKYGNDDNITEKPNK